MAKQMIRCKLLRLRLGMSQAQLRDYTDVPVSHINLIENGRLTRPYPTHLRRLNDFFSCVDELDWSGDDPDRLLDYVEVELVETKQG